MKTKVLILTPVYKDWENLEKILSKIDKIFYNEIKLKFDLIVVDDYSCSNNSLDELNYISIANRKIIKLHKNHGSQRAIALGLKYINKNYKKDYRVLIIDSDGQDNPSGILQMFNKIDINSETSVVAKRGQRKEPMWFKILYEIYCIAINLFALRKIRYGNFSLLSSNDVKKILEDNNLWNAFPPTLSTNVRNIEYITIDREKRLSGRSKMNFFGLLIHAFKVFSVLRFRILISTSVYSTFAYIFLFDKNFTTFFLITILFSFFNIINFTLSFFQRGKFEESFKKIKVL